MAIMDITIGAEAIKVACIQTVPGKELVVKEKLKKACDKLKIKQYHFLKCFGGYDIVLFYVVKGYGSRLRKGGPVGNIIKSNMWFCYLLNQENVKRTFGQFKRYAFSAFCLIKLNPEHENNKQSVIDILSEAAKYKDNASVLGTLGWNEFIVLISGDDLNYITQSLYSLATLLKTKRVSKYFPVLKTLSFLCMNYEYLPKRSKKKKSFRATKKFFEKFPQFSKSMISSKQSDPTALLEITASPRFYGKIKDYFNRVNFNITDTIGGKDLVVTPDDVGMTWSHFLAAILHSRYELSSQLISTSTKLIFDEIDTSHEIDTKYPVVELIDFDYKKLENTYNKDLASTLSSYYYGLNELLEDPICKSAYLDMVRFPRYIEISGHDINRHQESIADLTDGDEDSAPGGVKDKNYHFGDKARIAIKRGAQVRSYGTYGSLETVDGRFSDLRGGCQISLLAIELLPTHIFNGLGVDWMGFVLTSDPKFFTVGDAIAVPSDCMWSPEKWWAVFHEIAHVYIHNEPRLIEETIPHIKPILYYTNHPQLEIELYIELIAEVIGFELGFFDNFNLFMKLLWGHLSEIMPYQKEICYDHYAIRSFYVELFIGHMRRIDDVTIVKKEDFEDLDKLYRRFIEHLIRIEGITEKKLFPDKKFLAAENVKKFSELYNFTRALFTVLKDLDIRIEKRVLGYKSTKNIYDCISDGKIWWENIDYPDAILYKFFNQGHKMSHESKIALILSFWNQQNKNLRKRMKWKSTTT